MARSTVQYGTCVHTVNGMEIAGVPGPASRCARQNRAHANVQQASLCWIEHIFIWLSDIMPHASEDQTASSPKSIGQCQGGDGAAPGSRVGAKNGCQSREERCRTS